MRITFEDGTTVIGNRHWREIEYETPEWGDEPEACFPYKGETYYLSEFMRVSVNAPAWMQSFDGYRNDSFFSGLLVRLHEYGDAVQVFLYLS